jgi:hypothetical protein
MSRERRVAGSSLARQHIVTHHHLCSEIGSAKRPNHSSVLTYSLLSSKLFRCSERNCNFVCPLRREKSGRLIINSRHCAQMTPCQLGGMEMFREVFWSACQPPARVPSVTVPAEFVMSPSNIKAGHIVSLQLLVISMPKFGLVRFGDHFSSTPNRTSSSVRGIS